MERYKAICKKAIEHGLIFIKWSMLAIVTGIVVGSISIIFSKSMSWVTNFRITHNYIIYFLPVAGIFVVWLYRVLKINDDKGTNLVLTAISSDEDIPAKVSPLIFTATVITHLFGGSAGREGAALQLGGSLGNIIGKVFRLNNNDKKIIIMCGMSAAFSALFGTPMAAAVFPIEVAMVGVFYYAALMPCIFSSLIASHFAAGMGISPEAFIINEIPKASYFVYGKVVIISIVCAIISIIFCMILHDFAKYFKFIKNPYFRVIIGSVVIVLLTLIVNTRDYLGAGIPVIERAMEGQVDSAAFLWKMIFTAITLAIGFKGGEIVPTLFIGATLGCLMGHLLDISPSLCAAIGMAGLFCGVTNSPISTMLISFELFGFDAVNYFLIAIAINYVISGYIGLYSEQIIVHSKYKMEDVGLVRHIIKKDNKDSNKENNR